MANKPSVADQVFNGLRLATLVVLVCVTGTLFVWGALVVSHEVAGSVMIGWLALAVAFVILLLNLDGWAKILPGLLALAAFNAVLMAVSGHIFNKPSVLVSRGVAFGSAAALALAALISARFHGKRLSILDRIVLVAYVGFILLGLVSQWLLLSFTLGTLVLAVPWIKSQLHGSRPKPHHESGY
ncbi:MAG TPA: hypothetical protein VFB76_18390 [Candidatus Angelobacter sp.]|nr:hypothetical protein [Candidatus Angelobacter sp.]